MKNPVYGFSFAMKNARLLLFCYYFAVVTVLNVAPVQSEELVDVESWADFQTVNLVSVSAVAEDCQKIFDVCKADVEKVIDNLTQVIRSTEDATAGPPKVWDALTQITGILKNGSKNVRSHFSGIGDHFLKRLDGAMRIGKYKHSEKTRELRSIYDTDIDTSNVLVISLNKYFSNNYNPNSNLQETVIESLNQNTYSQSTAETELQQLSTVVRNEIDTLEKSAIKLLNEVYKGITIAKELVATLRSTGAYPEKWDEQYIKDILQNSTIFSKAITSENNENDANISDTAQPDTNTSETETNEDNDLDDLADVSLDATSDDNTGCAEIFRRTEKKITKQLVIAIKQIKLMRDAKEIDSRTFKIFKNYSFILSNLNQKVITAIITFVNQFFQLYHIVLSILDKINPDMKAKAIDILYMTDVDTSDSNYESINKFIVEDYLSSAKMNELYQRINDHVKSVKSLSEVKKGIIQEITVTTSGLGNDMQTMKNTIFYIFEEIQKGVTALQNLKNKSNRTGFRYYLNFYRGKADLKQLKKLMHIINSLNIELLLERQILSNEDEVNEYKIATKDFQSEIDKEYQKLMNELNGINDFTFARGFVSRSVLEYNMLLQSYSVTSRKTIKKVITKYVTIFEEIIIIIKRKKIKNANTIEDLFNCDASEISNNRDETISKYLLEKNDVDIEKLCTTLAQELIMETKETANKEIQDLNTVTHSEVKKISKTVLSIISNMSSEIQNLTKIKETASQNSEYEVTNEQLKCISNIITTINSLQIKSNKDEIQGLSIYFERVQEKIQISIQNFETETVECSEVQQFRTQVQTLKTSIYEALTKASFEINEKISRVIFDYNEKLYNLKKNTSYSELNNLCTEENSFSLNDITRKYITGCYTSEEIFKSIDDIMNAQTSTDIAQLKTDVSTQLDSTNQIIESELSAIHGDLNQFVQKFSEGMLVVKSIEAGSQKQTEQSEIIDQTKLEKLREVNDMVKVISKYVNINAESSEIELKVQIDSTRLRVSQLCEQVSQTLTTISDVTQIETTISESISNCETMYTELKNNSMIEINRNVNEFLESYRSTITSLQSQGTNDQVTFLQNQAYEAKEDKNYEKFYQLMCQQDYQSSNTVTEAFNYLKRYNSVDSKNIKEKSSRVFQSLSYKMNIEIDNVKYVSQYMLESLQEANKALIKLENSAKQNANITLNENELNQLSKVKSISESWNYNLHDNTMSSIATSINAAKREVDIEYKNLKTKIKSLNDENIIENEINTSLQNIQTIYANTQTSINEKINLSVTNFHTLMSNNITEFQSCGSETLYTTMQTILHGRSTNTSNEEKNMSENIDFDSFTQAANVREVYDDIKIKTNESSDSIAKINTNIEEFRKVMYENIEKVEKTSTYVVKNIQKGFTVISDIQNTLSQNSDYQLTQYQEQQLRKCVSIFKKIENLNINAKTAQERITSSIGLIKTEVSNEYAKVSDSVYSLTEEKSIEEAVNHSLNKFEQLFAQAKDTVKEQLSLVSSSFYSSFTKTLTSLKQQNSNEVATVFMDIKTGKSSYQASSEQSFSETISYFNSNSFKSCLSVKKWYNDIHSSTSVENYSSINESNSAELSSLNDQINSSLEKMESSSTYVLQSIERSTEILKEVEHSVKQSVTYQLTEEQITELQKCTSIYKSIQTVTSTSASTSMAQEVIENNISNVRNQIGKVYSNVTQSVASAANESSVEEIVKEGVKNFEQLFSQAKETVKEELSQSLTSFCSSFTQIWHDSKMQTKNEITTILQEIKSSTSQCENDQSFQDTVSYFSSSSFKSCVSVKKWFGEIRSSTSTNTSSNMNERTINEISQVNDQMNSSFKKMESSSTYVLDSIQQSIEVLKHIETVIMESTTYQLTQEEITILKKSMSIYHSIQSSINTSSSTSIVKQTIESDITNAREEINNTHARVTQSISSLTSENAINETATKGIEKYENVFSSVKESVTEQLSQSSSSFYNSYLQISSDFEGQTTSINLLDSENTCQFENDQSFSNLLSCLKSDTFKSSTAVHNWYKEIQSSTSETEWSYLSERVVNEFGTLNERVTQSIDSLKESSTNILNTLQAGSEVLKKLEESTIENLHHELTQDQVTYLQKCMTIYQTIQTITTSTSTTTFEAKQTITADISNMKNQISDEFAKVSQSINSLSDENSIRQAATEGVKHINEFYCETKGKVQSQLDQTFFNFLSNFEQISSQVNSSKETKIGTTLKSVVSDKSIREFESDQSYTNALSYLKSDSFASNTAIQNWYGEIQSSNTINESSGLNERAINELSTLNDRVTKSVTSLEENSSYILDTVEKSTQILKQIQQSSTQSSNYQLSQSDIIELQKCISIYTTIQSNTVNNSSSTTVSQVKNTIKADINNVRSEISNEFTKISQSVGSLSDISSIKQAASESVNNVDKYYTQMKKDVQSQLTETSSTLYSNIQNMVSIAEKQKNNDVTSILQNLVNNKDVHQSNNDQSFINTLQYLNSEAFISSSTVHKWYSDIQSNNSNSESSNVGQSTIKEMGMLNERVTKSIDTMEESSTNILDTIERGSNILKQVENSISQNSSYQLSEDQVSYLRKCVVIYHTIQNSTTVTNHTTSLSSMKEVLTTDITNAKSQINDEFSKVSQTLSSLKDESSIKKVVEENINKVNNSYGQVKEKIQSQLTEKASNFFNNCQQISKEIDKRGNKEMSSILTDIVNGKNSYQSKSDQSFKNVESYLKSDSFKSNEVIQNWYQEIHSNTSNNHSLNCNENAINELGTLNDRVVKSIDLMESNSLFVLDTIEKGSLVLKKVEESINQNSNYQLTQEEIIDLQKSIIIHQSIESDLKTTSSANISNEMQKITANSGTINNLTNTKQVIDEKVGVIKSQINDEFTKTSQSIRALSDENSIKQAVEDNVNKVDNYYNSARETIHSKLSETSSEFFRIFQETSSSYDSQAKSEIKNVFQDILSGHNSHQVQTDQSFTHVVSFLSSDSFKSNMEIKNKFTDIQSNASTSESTNSNERAVNELNSLHNHVTKSVDTMMENSDYIINAFKKGSEIIEQVKESSKQGLNYQLTQDEIIELQKCITIYQTMQSITNTTQSTISSQKNTTSDQASINQSKHESANLDTTNTSERLINENDHANNSADISSTSSSGAKKENHVDSINVSNFAQNGNDQFPDVEEVISPVKIDKVQQKTTAEVDNIKNHIKAEYTKISESISSLKDEHSIEQAVSENVNKVDQHYSEAKEKVQTQLTQTSSGFYNSCQKLAERYKKQRKNKTNTVLQDIVSGANTYAENDETFTDVISYLESDSFKSNSTVQNMYQEIHSNSANNDITSMSEHSINELCTLNDRVTQSVDTMEERSKYIFDTIKKGSEVLKQVEESSQQNSDYQLTQDQIVDLQKCITIYQTITTVTTTTTTTTNSTFLVSNDSVSNQSVTSDDEYEYITNVTKNTKQIVQVEETSQEESDVSIIKNQTISGHDVVESTSDSNSVIKNSSVSNVSSSLPPTPSDTPLINTGGKNEAENLIISSPSSSDTHQMKEEKASVSASHSTNKTTNSKNKDVLAEFEVNSNKLDTISKENNRNSIKRTTHSSKIELLKKFTQDQNTQSKISINELMVNWKVTKSTSKEWPNTCESLTWENEEYSSEDEDKVTIKEIAELLRVGRTVIEDSIELKKEKLPLYRDIDEIEMMVVSCIEVVDEILLQVAEVVGEDMERLRSPFIENLNEIQKSDSTEYSLSSSLSCKDTTLDQQFLKTSSTFFSMKGSKKTDLLNQINKQFGTAQPCDENESRQIATQKFDKLQIIMKSVLDNIDCLSLRAVDTIMNAKKALHNFKNTTHDDAIVMKIKNGQVFCDIVKIPSN